MKKALKDLREFKIVLTDGTSGGITDFLFDEKLWFVRYIEADFGSFLSSNRVLIPKSFLGSPDWTNEEFRISLKKEDLEKMPPLEKHKPVSRQYEEVLAEHFDMSPYWSGSYAGLTGMYYPPRPVKVPIKDVKEEDMDSVLRSFSEIQGYHIHALDDKIGHIEDLIVDEQEWQIVYAVIDTSNWLPWSKQVLVAIDLISKISYLKEEAKINLYTVAIKNSPSYDPSVNIDEELEQKLYDFFSRSLLK